MAAPNGPPLSATATAVLAVAAGGAIANNYAIQPALVTIAHSLNAASNTMSLVLTGAMAGYILGLVFLVPLADRVRPRVLIPSQLLGLALAVGLAATMQTAPALVACFVGVGAMSTVAAMSTALIGKLAPAEIRGVRMGVVASGISAGFLLSRFVGGALTSLVGWRAMLLCFALSSLVAAGLTRTVLPRDAPPTARNYLVTLRSIPELLIAHTALRRACAAGMLWFFAFNLVWVGISVRLAKPPYSLSPSTIGLYSLAGTLGLLVTRFAGRTTDRYGTRLTMTVALLGATVGAALLALVLGHPARTVTGLAIFDAGCFAAQVANQVAVVSLDQHRSGSFSSVYLVLYYAAGAVGTAAAGLLLTMFGWRTLGTIAALATAAGATITLIPHGHRTRPPSQPATMTSA